MSSLPFPFVTVAVLTPLIAIVVLRLTGAKAARLVAALAALVALASSTAALVAVTTGGGVALGDAWSAGLLDADSLNVLPLVLFAGLALVTVLVAPKRDIGLRELSALLVVLSATLATYATDNLVLLFVAWTVSVVPFVTNWLPAQNTDAGDRGRVLAGIALIGSVVFLGAAIALMSGAAGGADSTTAGRWAFALLMVAVALRKGVFPMHSWVACAFDRGPLLLVTLLVNVHIGAFVVLRVAIPRLPEVAREAFPLLTDLALFTALLGALAALAEKRPRRIIGMVIISQAACILAGIESASVAGVGGAMVLWMVVAVASTGLLAVHRAIEVRFGNLTRAEGYQGLAARAPRLAVFWVLFALALVGLPGTLGFCAEDLLLHGALETHPFIGLALPAATGLNAFLLLRLFTRIFLGKRLVGLPKVDALPRERWALTAVVLFLIIGGVAPSVIVKVQAPAAERVLSLLDGIGPQRARR
ncbi:MAG: hypothetical protein IT168_16355 [Bryobacterales bacterium]|nr:hypothetical protein [Bryobacterales bacterium]